jgi:hypothetical protein
MRRAIAVGIGVPGLITLAIAVTALSSGNVVFWHVLGILLLSLVALSFALVIWPRSREDSVDLVHQTFSYDSRAGNGD